MGAQITALHRLTRGSPDPRMMGDKEAMRSRGMLRTDHENLAGGRREQSGISVGLNSCARFPGHVKSRCRTDFGGHVES